MNPEKIFPRLVALDKKVGAWHLLLFHFVKDYEGKTINVFVSLSILPFSYLKHKRDGLDLYTVRFLFIRFNFVYHPNNEGVDNAPAKSN